MFVVFFWFLFFLNIIDYLYDLLLMLLLVSSLVECMQAGT